VTTRKAFQVGALVWAAVGLVVALGSQGRASAGIRPLVGVLSVPIPLMAVLAAAALAREKDRLAGLFLVVSAATPTYFWVLNLPALIVGLALLTRGRVSLRRAPGPSSSGSSGPAT
jgi:hypothetical protein